MPSDFQPVFDKLKSILSKHAKKLAVLKDTPGEYTLVTKSPSPFPQHKGQPLWFGYVKIGRAYVSIHLMGLYMNSSQPISPELQERKQGKTCFNFKTVPEPEILAELARITDASLKGWAEKKWL